MTKLPNFLARGFRFQPGLFPTLAAALCVVATVFLGHWQQGRAAEKRVQQALFDVRISAPILRLGIDVADEDQLFRAASARGTWKADHEIFIDNKVEHGVAGFHVVTPLQLEGTNRYLLVNRGWVARGGTYPAPPYVPAKPGVVSVTGSLTRPTSRFLELMPEHAPTRTWQNLTIERYRAVTGLDALPYVMLADSAELPLERVIVKPNAGADKHTEYMLTWYSLSLTVVILWIALNVELIDKRAKSGANEASAEAQDLK